MSSNTNSNSSSGGLGFVGALTILFVALKLTNVIHWSWVWVLSPLWIGVVVVAAVLFLAAFGFLVKAMYKDRRRRAERRAKRFPGARP